MQKFSFSGKNRALPDAYTADGSAYPIYTDFRRILRILRLLNDPQVLDADKHSIMLSLFFRGEIPPDPQAALSWFVNCGQVREGSGDHDFDFEQDAAEIYSAFMQVYRIDLLQEDMHFWRFSMLLDGLFSCENALSNKVRLRHADDSTAKRKNDFNRAKRNVEIGRKISSGDAAVQEALLQRLQEGKPINDLLGGVDCGRRKADI